MIGVHDNMGWRNKIYDTIETERNSIISKIYDWSMLFFIVISIIPLAFREQNVWLEWFDKVSVTVFIVDYLLRWLTADLRMNNRPKWVAFLTYPFSAFAIVDLLSILPSVAFVNKALKLFRITRLFKILRVFKFIRYSRNVQILLKVLYKERHILFVVLWIALFYIVVTALIMFNVDVQEFISMLPENEQKQLNSIIKELVESGSGIISMLSAILGVAIIALPSGVITASYLDELREAKNEEKDTQTR